MRGMIFRLLSTCQAGEEGKQAISREKEITMISKVVSDRNMEAITQGNTSHDSLAMSHYCSFYVVVYL